MSNPGALKFVDLFSGLGGFHVALSQMGHDCVYACELDERLRNVYSKNFEITPNADIRECWDKVPNHDILCAGFPCQPFSKAGTQLGFNCPNSGDLFNYILKIIDANRPQYLIFENVPNLIKHNKGETWNRIYNELTDRGYGVDFKEISPHEIGIPQIRRRAIIVGSLSGLDSFKWPEPTHSESDLHISSILDKNPPEATPLTSAHIEYLTVWNEFLEILGPNAKMPSFPIWAMEFGANYPFEVRAPSTYSQSHLSRFKGAFGVQLKGSKENQLQIIPSYARQDVCYFPDWKVRFIQQNRDFYNENQKKLEKWLPKVMQFHPSFQKLEWNWQDGNKYIWDKVLQFRASGIRVKKPSTAPSLVALTSSQVPIIPWEKRYMTVKECSRLQSLGGLRHLPPNKTRAFKALGNAVNADVISVVAKKLIVPQSRPEKKMHTQQQPDLQSLRQEFRGNRHEQKY